MKKFFYLVALTALVLNLSSCNNDELPQTESKADSGQLKIKTEVAAIDAVSTRATPISAFGENAQLGLFVTSGTLDNMYESYNANANVPSILANGVWSQSPVVRLTGENATVFAYYPYSDSNTDGKAIKIDNAAQHDYMYGTHTAGQSAINRNNPSVNLTMYHALAMIQFNISKSGYPWPGELTRIEIANATGKTALYSEGTMDISTGIITGTSGKNSGATLPAYSVDYPLMTIPENMSANEADFLKIFVLPVSSTGSEGDVVFNFTIDNRIYSWKVPANTLWKGGTKNTYTVTISGTVLIIGNVIITDWTGGTNGSIGLAD